MHHDLVTIGKVFRGSLVTNLEISPWRVYLFYNPRATIEKNIRELLYDYHLGKIPSSACLRFVMSMKVMTAPRVLPSRDIGWDQNSTGKLVPSFLQ